MDNTVAAFLQNFGKPLSPSAKRARLKKENKKRLALGILPVPEEYMSTQPADMENVEANPECFIVPECIPACQEFWRKNIYTCMVCDILELEQGFSWICLRDILSDRNREILDEIGKIPCVRIDRDGWFENTVYIYVPFVGETARTALFNIAKQFEMQDVPEFYAYRKHEPTVLVRSGEILTEDGRVYFSSYHYKKHLNYLESLETK